MIVADASWVVALRDSSDDHHARAVAINQLVGNEGALLHPVTLAECLIAPAQLGALDSAAAALRASFEVPEVDQDAPLRWAALRVETALRLPDAIVLDTALSFNARALATFDARLAAAARDHQIEVLDAEAIASAATASHGLPHRHP